MRALVQRVSEASVTVNGDTIAQVEHGLLVLVCAMDGDGDEQAQFLARKIANLRIFEDDQGKMNKSVLDACRPRPCRGTGVTSPQIIRRPSIRRLNPYPVKPIRQTCSVVLGPYRKSI